ncbi:MAG: hypothetical protein H0U53_07255 [Actinobacteria bacterium]|nr:hypothetical protein [Actinomycetota bacterium]
MGFDPMATKHLMGLLTNLYADPLLACIREYSTNALDSNIAAGNPDPIKVTLPHPGHPYLTIEDAGLGLSLDELRNLYSMYGASSKRESNAYNGCLGVGSKAGLAYAVSFTVTAIRDGEQVVATIAKVDGTATIRVLDISPTAGRNGVTITIPIKACDYAATISKADSLFSHWSEDSVLVDGQPPSRLAYKDALWLDDDVCVLPNIRRDSHSLIVMGNVPYPVPTAQHYGTLVIARVDYGLVDFTPSRESLNMSDPSTKDTLAELAAYVKQYLPHAVERETKNAPTPWDAAKIRERWNVGGAKQPKLETLCERDVWSYTPNQWQDKAENCATIVFYRTLKQEAVVLVENYPLRTVTPTTKLRLSAYGRQTYLLLPPGTIGMEGLKGRSNIIDWAQIENATAHVKPLKVERTKRVKGEWDVKVTTGRTRRPIDTARPYCWEYASTQGEQRANRAIRVWPEVQVIFIYERSKDKLHREVPGIKDLHTWCTEQQAAAVAALTEDDRLRAWARRESWLQLVDPFRLHDPLLRRAAECARVSESVAMRQVRALCLSFTTDDLGLADRYPLVAGGATRSAHEDAVLYCNAKYATIHTNKQGT